MAETVYTETRELYYDRLIVVSASGTVTVENVWQPGVFGWVAL